MNQITFLKGHGWGLEISANPLPYLVENFLQQSTRPQQAAAHSPVVVEHTHVGPRIDYSLKNPFPPCMCCLSPLIPGWKAISISLKTHVSMRCDHPKVYWNSNITFQYKNSYYYQVYIYYLPANCALNKRKIAWQNLASFYCQKRAHNKLDDK